MATVFLVTFASLGCANSLVTHDDQGSDRAGINGVLVRTSLETWETRDFSLSRARIEIPSDSCAARDSAFSAVVGLHRWNPPAGVLDDSTCLIEILIQHTTEEALAKRRESLLRYLDERKEHEREFWRWAAASHDRIEVFRRENSSTFLYEVPCGDGTLLEVQADVRLGAESGHAREDEDAVRRILGSVRCLPARG